MSVLHKLSDCNKEWRLLFAAWAQEKNVTLLNRWFSDEAHFYLDGTINKQNVWFWATQYPQNFHQ
jgi:hypothetical protein